MSKIFDFVTPNKKYFLYQYLLQITQRDTDTQTHIHTPGVRILFNST